ncbi:hypothetical protein TNCV_2425701 [Trichonephila clavipes]|nr:hypothetical protein TNCV_2425701 [Trichonephila clavipes]
MRMPTLGLCSPTQLKQAPNPSKPNAPFNSQLPKFHLRTLPPYSDSNIDPINERIRSLSRTFYDHVNIHNNPLIAIQSTSTTAGLYNHPSHSSSIPSIF